MANPNSWKRIEDALQAAIAGVKSEIADGASLTLAGAVFSKAELISALEADLSHVSAVRDAFLAYKSALQARNGAATEVKAHLANLRIALAGLYGEGSEELAKFGLKPRKPKAPLSAEQELAKVTNARTTRALRGTKGSRQKEAIRATAAPIISASPAPSDASALASKEAGAGPGVAATGAGEHPKA